MSDSELPLPVASIIAEAKQAASKSWIVSKLHACFAALHELPDWRTKPAREIARAIGCRHFTVNRWRRAHGLMPTAVTYSRKREDGLRIAITRKASNAVGRAPNSI